MQAIIYARFSSLEQRHGSSLARQREICRTFAQGMGWSILEAVEDQGTSAYTGANITTGNLSRLTARLEKEGGTGIVIVVEQLDRLTRRPAVEVLAWIGRITATGACIATANDRLVIDAQRLATDQMTVVGTVFNSFRAYMESAHKSERLTDAWQRKRAAETPLTSRAVAWVELRNGEFVAIEERAEIVRTIYTMAAAGTGAVSIARHLNEQAIAAWGSSDGWRDSYIKKILQSRAVLGEYQPHRKPRGQKRTAIGDARQGYYPQVVSDELWQAVQNRSRHNGHAAARQFNNLLSGIGYCGVCDGKMTRIYKGPRWEYLRCERSRRGLCENSHNYKLRLMVDGILDQLLTRAMDPSHFANGERAAELTVATATARRTVDDLTTRRDRVRLLFEAGDDGALERVRQLSAELVSARDTLERLAADLAREQDMPLGAHMRAVGEVRAAMDSEDEAERLQARMRVKAALDAVIERAVFRASGDAWVPLRGGIGGVFVEVDEQGRHWSGTVDFVQNGDVPPAIADMQARRERVADVEPWTPA